MIRMSKLAVIAAVAAVSIASPALAQSFNPRDGGANTMPFSYGPGGTRVYIGSGVSSAPAQEQNGLHSFASIPENRPAVTSVYPGETGGGSAGYNTRLLQH
jgi:hypothetical protein